jgi:hypothetical protein
MTDLVCKNCGNNFSGKYCNICGEKVFTEKEKSVRHILGEGLHFITHFEGTFFKTLKTLFSRPGKLSSDYCNGIRKKYFKPLSLFLMIVIIYLIFPVFGGLNMNLIHYKTNFFYGGFVNDEIDRTLKINAITETELAEAFRRTSEKTSKFLLFIIIPFTAFFSYMLGWKKRRPYFDHFVFSTEACSFFVLWGFLILPLLGFLFMKLLRWFPDNDLWLGSITFAAYIPFLTMAAKRFFTFKWVYSILYSVFFSGSLLIVIQSIYKFILFFIAIRLV